MRPSSEFRHGESSSSTHFRFRHGSSGELSEEEGDTLSMAKMIEQHKKLMTEEGNPLQFQHNNLGSKKEANVTIQGRKEEEHVAIQEEGTPMQFQHVTIQVEPNAPPTPGVAGIWINALLILLLVPAVIFGLHLSGVI